MAGEASGRLVLGGVAVDDRQAVPRGVGQHRLVGIDDVDRLPVTPQFLDGLAPDRALAADDDVASGPPDALVHAPSSPSLVNAALDDFADQQAHRVPDQDDTGEDETNGEEVTGVGEGLTSPKPTVVTVIATMKNESLSDHPSISM